MDMRRHLRIHALFLAALLPAAGSLAAQAGESGITERPAEKRLPIEQLDAPFLYLAATQALEDGNPALATDFLKAVVKKDATAIFPRLQLAELLLRNGQARAADEQVHQLLNMPGLSNRQQRKAELLNVQLLVLDGQEARAIKSLRSMLRQTPEAYPLRLMLIRLLSRAKRYREAHEAIRAGLKQGRHPQLLHIDAQLYMRQGRLNKAAKSLKKLAKLEPDSPATVLMSSRLALKQNKPVKAENLLRHFLARHPDALSVSNALGRLLVRQGRNREAARVYENIAERTGGNPDVLMTMGLLYYQQRDFAHAAASFRRALGQRRDARARFYLAASLDSLGKDDEARKLYSAIPPEDENHTRAQLRLAALDLRDKRNDEAVRTLHGIIRAKPENAEAYVLLSAALLRIKAYKRLLQETEPALALPKVPTQLLFNRAAAYEGQKQYARAAGQIKKLFSIDPDNIEALNFLGYLYAEQGIRLNEAEQLIRKALAKQPDNGYYLDSLAWVHFRRAEYDKALLLQKKAVRIVPDDPVMREHLGDILWKMGKPELARKAWKKAVQLGHDERARMLKKISQGL